MFVKVEFGQEGHSKHANMVRYHGVLESICRDKTLLPINDRLYFEVRTRLSSSVLFGVSLRRFADIEWLTSARHRWSRTTVAAISSRKHCLYVCLCGVGERMNVHFVFLDDFGQVRRVQDEETRTKNRCLWHRSDSVNHGQHGTEVSDTERSALPCRHERNHCMQHPGLSLKTEHYQVMVDSVESR